MGTEFIWDTDDRRMRTRLRKVEGAASDLTPVWVVTEAEFIAQNEKQFGRQGLPRWKPLSPAYAKRKARLYPGPHLILDATGGLRRSLTTNLDVHQIEPKFMVVGSRSKIGGYHRKGAYRKRGGRLPRRQPVALPASFRTKTRARVRKHIVDAATGGEP